MKKIMFFAAIAATLSLASCQKEELNGTVNDNPSAVSEAPVFTATISQGSKTTVDASTGKVSWESTDEINVTDAAQNTAVYKIKSIDPTTGKATFEFKSGSTLGAGPYTATYGTAPATAQTYSATAGKFYMTAPATTTNSFTFGVQCGLMKISLTKTGESVKIVEVTGTPTGGTKTTYTLTCTDAQSIASEKAFYVAVPAGSYNRIEVTNNSGYLCILTSASGITVPNNGIKPVTISDSKINFAVPYVTIAGLKWAKQNVAISTSGKKAWNGGSGSAVKVPGTNEDVVIGDFFQWAAYAGYSGATTDDDKGLLIYTSFTNQGCGDGSSTYTHKSGKNFGTASSAPYYSSGTGTGASYSKYTSSTETLELSDDVANIILGGTWRIPTSAEWEAMIAATYWAWDNTHRGHYVLPADASHPGGGYGNIASGDEEKALFFVPASGYGKNNNNNIAEYGTRNRMWSSSVTTTANEPAYMNTKGSSGYEFKYDGHRYYGENVRAVTD